MMVTGKGMGRGSEGKVGPIYGDGRDMTLGGEHTMHCTVGISENCTLETYIILLTNVTTMNFI